MGGVCWLVTVVVGGTGFSRRPLAALSPPLLTLLGTDGRITAPIINKGCVCSADDGWRSLYFALICMPL